MIDAHGVPLSARHKQVEQDRTSPVLVHHAELAREAAGELCGILSLIAATTTATGLTVESVLDPAPYPAGRKVTDEEMATIQIQRDAFHGEWNYTISPRVAASDMIIV